MATPTSYSWQLPAVSPRGSAVPASSGARITGNGKTGVAVPVTADGRGRLSLLAGEPQTRKLILLNLADLESDNPFQGDIGMGAFMIFALDESSLRAEIKRRVGLLFRRLQLIDRARLTEPPTFEAFDGELTVTIKYINLEENKPDQVGLKFSLSQTQQAASNALVAALKGVL